MIDEEFRARWSPRLYAIVRLIAGLMFMQHGLSKYFAFPGTSPPGFHAMGLLGVAGVIEIVCGALVAVGLFTRVAAFLASGEMAVAYFMAHAPRAFYPIVNGGELAVFYCFFFLYIAVEGSGPWSIDRARS